MQPRKCLIVYFKSPKVLKRLKSYGNLTYYHKKRKYAVLYVDEDKMQDTIDRIEKLHHVRKAEASMLDDTAYKPEDFNNLGKMEDQDAVTQAPDSDNGSSSEEKT
ncbi:MAG: DUF2129 domain-containing protein [Bacillota bacterium]